MNSNLKNTRMYSKRQLIILICFFKSNVKPNTGLPVLFWVKGQLPKASTEDFTTFVLTLFCLNLGNHRIIFWFSTIHLDNFKICYDRSMIITSLNIFMERKSMLLRQLCTELAAILFHSNIEINGGLLSIFGKYWQLSAICSV